MNFKNIFKNSLKLSWRNKYLWFFGLFAALLGNNNEFEILSGSLSGEISQTFLPGLKDLAGTGIFSRQAITGISKILVEDPLLLLVLLFFLFILIILAAFLFWLTIISQVALVNSSAGILNNKNHGFKTSLFYGIKRFWPVFLLNISSKILIFLVFYLLSLSIIVNFKVIYIITFFILIPLSIIFSFIIKYAIAYLVIRQSNLKKSIGQGWMLFKNYWFASIKMAFMLFLISVIISLAVILLLTNLNTVFAFITMFIVEIAPGLGFWLFVVLKSLVVFLTIIFISLFLAVFQTLAWINLFFKLTKK